MARRVTWTEIAWGDLEAATSYIARDSRRYAAAFMREAQEAGQSLAEFSERGRVVPEFRDPTLRELLVRSYRLIYRLTDEEVRVVAFIHGARDLRPLWAREERQ